MRQHRSEGPNTPPRRSLGQHFLQDTAIIDRIIACFQPSPRDRVVEIGPGRGALTFRLADLLGELHVVEIDRTLAKELNRHRDRYPSLHVHTADALTLDYCALAAGRQLRIIGNLPYNVSTPLLFRFLHHRQCIGDMLLMLQKEVVERMCASPGNRDYGRLSVMLQQSCAVDELFEVAPAAFSPPPKVNSAVARLVPYTQPPYPVSDHGVFASIVQAAFNQRRKTIRNALKKLADDTTFSRAGIDPGARAETLSVADYVRLSELSR